MDLSILLASEAIGFSSFGDSDTRARIVRQDGLTRWSTYELELWK
jgi:hypothetical protein